MWTNRYDNARSGVQTGETTLTPLKVSGGKFGLLFSRTVDGTIQAQPLYVPGLTIGGSVHNVVVVATEHDSVYAFDADIPAASAPLWMKSLGPAAPFASSASFSCKDLQPEVGITSTPVIDASGADPTTWTIYVEAKTLEAGVFHQRLHALDLSTGTERSGSPIDIAATVSGTGDGSVGGMIAFRPENHIQRAALLLDGGTVYVAFASHCDAGPYHGWVLAYDAKTLALKGTFVTTPGTGEGGIWQSGMGMTADGTGVYFVSGNGPKNVQPVPGKELGLSVGRLTLGATGLGLADYWTASAYVGLNGGDTDLSTAPVLDTGSKLAFVGGKDGKLRVLDRTHLGNFNGTADQIVQTVPLTFNAGGGHSHGGPVIWNGPSGMRMFVWPEQGPLQVFAVNPKAAANPVTATAVSVTPASVPLPPHPGGMLTVSSNGATAGTGIVWAGVVPNNALDAWHSMVPGSLYAFDAEDVSKGPVWTSDQAAMGRDTLGIFAKFCPPTIANGRVYIGTGTTTDALRVYGLMP